MPLRDHFHRPLAPRYPWSSFHGSWATLIGLLLNRILPPGYHAAPLANFGIEIDVPTFDVRANGSLHAGNSVSSWSPGAPAQKVAVTLTTDEIEVRVFRDEDQGALVGAIELVSPANKDRAETQAAFVAKCSDVLLAGAGLIVVDVVTNRNFNFHAALLARLAAPAEAALQADLYATSYRPVRGDDDRPQLEVWAHRLETGQPLPTLPLWLAGGPMVPVELEASYEQTYSGLRLPP